MINLNDVFPPALVPARNRNIKLSPSERQVVDTILLSIDNNSEDENKAVWKDYVSDLVPVLKMYNNDGSTKGMGGNVKYLPLELIQLIYFISYKFKVTQKDMLEFFKENGINRTKKLFNMEVHVDDYKKCVEYEQPDMHIKYQGQKDEILAEAIKHLVFQAGTYDSFIDIFGGSGAATLAVPHRSNAVYVYNDLDYGLYALFDTIADDIEYKTLIQYIKELQNDLAGVKVFRLLDVVGTTLSKEINIYANNKKRKYEREKYLIDMSQGRMDNEYPDDYSDVEQQYRFYGWYCYFDNLTNDTAKHSLIAQGVQTHNGNNIEDKIVLALAELYIWSFTDRSTKGVSPITRMFLTMDEIYQY